MQKISKEQIKSPVDGATQLAVSRHQLLMTTTMAIFNQKKGDNAIQKTINVQSVETLIFIQSEYLMANHIVVDVSLLKVKKQNTSHHILKKGPFISNMNYLQNRKSYQTNQQRTIKREQIVQYMRCVDPQRHENHNRKNINYE